MKTLYQTTIVIISEYDPTFRVEIDDLARDAMAGESYCYGQETVEITCDKLEGEGVREFFQCEEEEGEDADD